MHLKSYRSIIGIVAILLLPAAVFAAPESIVEVHNQGDSLFFEPTIEAADMILTVTGPCNYKLRRSLKDHGELVFQLDATTIDGRYRFEVTAVPEVDPGIIKVLQAAREADDNSEVDQLCRDGKLPQLQEPAIAGFGVLRGEIVYDPGAFEKGAATEGKVAELGPVSGGTARGGNSPVATKDFVIIDDLIVDGSACIGFDCVNGESFGFDTIRLKENNLRIKFDDTSTAASFPRNDWQLTANDSANGGASKFSIDDISGSRTPFTVEANARSHSLYVDDGGRIGSRTSTPSVEIHTIDGDTPTLRLQQDGSSGFAPQTWDVAGNETSFFVRDATNGSTLPFRIQPGASSNVVFIANDDDVGFGTTSPEEEIHVVGTADPRILVEDTLDNSNDKPGLVLRSPAAASGGDWRFETDNAGNFQIDFGPSTGPELLISDTTGATNGTVTINGDLMVNGICTGCDGVFDSDFPLPSMDEQAAFMYENSYLPAVGPTPEGKGLINVFEKTTGMLQELEKAHVYIDQLHTQMKEQQSQMAEMARLLEELRADQ